KGGTGTTRAYTSISAGEKWRRRPHTTRELRWSARSKPGSTSTTAARPTGTRNECGAERRSPVREPRGRARQAATLRRPGKGEPYGTRSRLQDGSEPGFGGGTARVRGPNLLLLLGGVSGEVRRASRAVRGRDGSRARPSRARAGDPED